MALAGSVAVPVYASGVSAASIDDWTTEIPEHTTITYETDVLEHYRPLFVTRDINAANLQGLYGFVARSTEFDSNVCVYACSYATQEGISPLAPPLNDSHYGDHEWVYVFWNDDSGDVEEIAYSAYHWIAGRAYGESIPVFEETHPKLHIVSPWHQYYVTTDEGEFVELYDLKSSLQGWLDNGMDEHLHLPAVAMPWTMQTRAHWWKNTVGEFSVDAVYASLMYDIGFFGAEQADIVEF
jgi:hypothetical protein